MVSKVIQTNTGNDVKYKIIKDGYKTVSETIHVDDTLPTRSTYNLEPSSVAYDPQLNYTIDTTHDYPPVLQFNENVIAPDDVEIETNRYLIAPYGQDYLIIDNGEDVDNFTRVGDVNIYSNGISNNFSNTNYIKFQGYTSPVTSFEFVLHIKTPQNWRSGVDSETLGLNQADYKGIMLYFAGANTANVGKLGLVIENVIGSSWYDSGFSSYIFETNTEYYIKTTFSDNLWNVYYSSDNLNWTEILSLIAPYPTADDNYCLGNSISSWSGNNWFTGSIYLNDTYIKINDEIWWKPTWKRLYPQYQPIGAINITNGIANYFSSNNYIRILNFQPGSSKWEITTKVIVTSNSTTQCIFGCYENRYYCPYLRIYNGKLTLYLSSNGSSWNIASNVTSSYTFTANTWHTVTLSWTGSQYKVIVDGTTHITVNSTTAIIRNSYPLCIGKYISSTYLLTGTIDLNETYVKINNQIVFEQFNTLKINGSIHGYPIVYNDGIVGGFSTSGYIVLPKSFDPGNNPWEWIVKINTGSRSGQFIGGYDYSGEGIEVGMSDNKMIWWLGTAYNVYDIASGQTGTHTLAENTDYWIKMEFNGTKYTLSYSIDKNNWVEDIVTISSLCIGPYVKVFGCDRAQGSAAWGGKIDFSETSIKINGQNWWDGVYCSGEYVPGILNSNYVDTGDQATLNLYDVQTEDRTLVLNTDRNVNVSNKKYVQYDGQVTIPDHGLSLYDNNTKTWSKYRYITLNVNNTDTVIYTEGDIS